jgi:hypothetical protein
MLRGVPPPRVQLLLTTSERPAREEPRRVGAAEDWVEGLALGVQPDAGRSGDTA